VLSSQRNGFFQTTYPPHLIHSPCRFPKSQSVPRSLYLAQSLVSSPSPFSKLHLVQFLGSASLHFISQSPDFPFQLSLLALPFTLKQRTSKTYNIQQLQLHSYSLPIHNEPVPPPLSPSSLLSHHRFRLR
jgi:hypothetical protein